MTTSSRGFATLHLRSVASRLIESRAVPPQNVWEATSAPMSLVLFGVSAVLVALGLTIVAAVTAIPLLLNVLVTAGLEARANHRLEQVPIADAIVLALVADACALALVGLRRLDLPRRWAVSRSASRAATEVQRRRRSTRIDRIG